jgi:uncharacterized membrane protein
MDQTTTEFDPADIEQNKVMAILAYIGILVIVPLLAAKQSPYARYHTVQGFNLFVIAVACYIVLQILMAILPLFVSAILSFLFSLLSIALLVLAIIGIINAAQGKAKELPVIGGMRILKI